jgi:hypothetical protein
MSSVAPSPPEQGRLVDVRQRRWVVADVARSTLPAPALQPLLPPHQFVMQPPVQDLGVSPTTLRNRENAGKVVAVRHPVNGYRLFRREDLDALLKQVGQASGGPSKG